MNLKNWSKDALLELIDRYQNKIRVMYIGNEKMNNKRFQEFKELYELLEK